jgi:hypothetical protein
MRTAAILLVGSTMIAAAAAVATGAENDDRLVVVRAGWLVADPSHLDVILYEYSRRVGAGGEIPPIEPMSGSLVYSLEARRPLLAEIAVSAGLDYLEWESATSGESALQRLESSVQVESFRPLVGLWYRGLCGSRGGIVLGGRAGPAFDYYRFRSELSGEGPLLVEETRLDDVRLSWGIEADLLYRIRSRISVVLYAGYDRRVSGTLTGTVRRNQRVDPEVLRLPDGRAAQLDLSGLHFGLGLALHL